MKAVREGPVYSRSCYGDMHCDLTSEKVEFSCPFLWAGSKVVPKFRRKRAKKCPLARRPWLIAEMLAR